jgi:autotransporter adhesin
MLQFHLRTSPLVIIKPMRRIVILTVLLAFSVAPAADAGLAGYVAGGGDSLSLKGGRGTALLVNTDGAVLGSVKRGRVVITAPARRRAVSGCEQRRYPRPRRVVCIGWNLHFSVLGGAWRVRLTGSGINASAVMNGFVTLDDGSAGTYSIRHGVSRPWPVNVRTFYLG